MKVCVYAICLNEAAHVERFMASTAGADLVVVADTGSSDDSVARLRALGAQVHDVRIAPWRFDHARNAALALVPEDVDVCLSLDLDQVLNPGWREALEAGWGPGVTHARHTEVWGRHEGTPRTFLALRAHARHGWRWTRPCHEYLECIAEPGLAAVLSGLVVEELKDETKPRDYLPLIELAVRERPDDLHAAHHLGRELLRLGRFADAEAALRRYLATAGAERGMERNLSLRMLGDAMERQGRRDEALEVYRQATAEAPTSRGAATDLAFALYEHEDWAAGYEAATRAAALPWVVAEYGDDSQSGGLPDDLASLCAWRLGRREAALAHARRAASQAPGSERIVRNLARLEAVVGKA